MTFVSSFYYNFRYCAIVFVTIIYVVASFIIEYWYGLGELVSSGCLPSSPHWDEPTD